MDFNFVFSWDESISFGEESLTPRPSSIIKRIFWAYNRIITSQNT
jgi:hypothetical protein